MSHYTHAGEKWWKRQHLLHAQGHRCFYCLRSLRGLPPDRVTLDHLVPVRKGGGDDLGNLVVSCERCNTEKDDREVPAEWVRDRRRYFAEVPR